MGSRHSPAVIIRDFPVEITFFRYLQSAVDARKLKQQLQQNDITYEVRRSVAVSKQETSANFHLCQVRQKTYDFIFVFVIFWRYDKSFCVKNRAF